MQAACTDGQGSQIIHQCFVMAPLLSSHLWPQECHMDSWKKEDKSKFGSTFAQVDLWELVSAH